MSGVSGIGGGFGGLGGFSGVGGISSLSDSPALAVTSSAAVSSSTVVSLSNEGMSALQNELAGSGGVPIGSLGTNILSSGALSGDALAAVALIDAMSQNDEQKRQQDPVIALLATAAALNAYSSIQAM